MGRPERSLLETVSRRTELIEYVREGIDDKRVLTERLDISRATVDRAMRELESEGLVDRTRKGYRLTLAGELAYTEFHRLMDRFETICLTRDLLGHLPADIGIDPAALAGSEISLAERPIPHEPLRQLEALIEEHDRVNCYASVVFPTSIAAFHRQITGTETEFELLLDERLLERLRTSYGEELRDVLGEENCTVRQVPSDHGLDAILALFDGRVVWLGIYDDDGDIRGAIILDSESGREWARERLELCREAGREVDELPDS